MKDLKRQTVRWRTWLAWAGTTEELRGIGRVVERLYETIPAQDNYCSSSDSFFNRDKLKFETTVTHGDDPVAGNLDSVAGDLEGALAELDRRTATSVIFQITGLGADPLLRLKMNWLGMIHLTISSSDLGWAHQALGSVSEELDKGRPWWAWARSTWGRTLVVDVSALTVATSVLLLIASFVGSFAEYFWQPIVGFVAFVAVQVIGLSERVYRWLFPRVELITVDGQSTGSRRFVLAGSLVLSFVVGVIVNFVS